MTKQQIIDEAMKLDSEDQEDIAESVWRIAHAASRKRSRRNGQAKSGADSMRSSAAR